ncbi:type III-A CRISPR-associated protein Cas10/Csm1 [Fodinisporobacter ferrooxydans]|uniref:CRISPR system single-strand-specific deoxyribonuclease Cas10/Csm1 (subtype III-A) n=1 Tax=Fodinisporobacter ferrooxydans TaxID=2901836 RepID=A0ABY4CRB1_9BACL|nr:type III-A CRISPR-associated protein Cas10/Csm1 [Alicyclobacillaceae bacterium MYW30-H2]
MKQADIILTAMYFPVFKLFETYLSKESYSAHLSCIQRIQNPFDGKLLIERLKSILTKNSNDEINRLNQTFELVGFHQYSKDPMAMVSVYCHVELEQSFWRRSYYRLSRLNPEAIFADQQTQNMDILRLREHLEDFRKELESLFELQWSTIDQFIVRISNSIQQWLWCIPAPVKGLPMESVSDLCRMAASISACLLQHTDQISILVGDISGIQRYIFDIAASGQKGIARRLRARSMYVALLSEAMSQMITNHFHISPLNVIMSSGGKFYILVPGGEEINDKLDRLQEKLDTWMIANTNGELIINLGWFHFEKDQIRDGDFILEKLNESLLLGKSRPLSGTLIHNQTWYEEKWIIQENKEHGRCIICKKFKIHEKDKSMCRFCYRDHQIGRKLLTARFIAFYHKSHVSGDIEFLDGISVTFHDELPQQNEQTYVVWAFQTVEDKAMIVNLPLLNKMISNHVPWNGNEVLSFDEIAERSKGTKQLGFLKADVDNLGIIMTFGLKKNDKKLRLSVISSLSFMLDMFFSGWLSEQLKIYFPNIYTVFSGGDDLYIIGPWEEITKFSIVLKNSFYKHVCNHPDITISAGLTFAHPKSPIHYQTELTENELENAKEIPSIENNTSRNQVSIFNTSLSWERFALLLEETDKLLNWWQMKKISSSILYRLSSFANDYISYRNGEIGPTYLPWISYMIKQNISRQDTELFQWVSQFIDSKYIDSQEMNPLAYIPVQVKLLQMFKKEEFDNDGRSKIPQ